MNHDDPNFWPIKPGDRFTLVAQLEPGRGPAVNTRGTVTKVRTLVGFGVMLVSTSQISSIVQTAFLGVLFGLTQGLSYPAMMARMVDRSTDSNRSVVVALFTGSFGVGINVSVPLWGLVAKFQGLSVMFLIGGLLILLGAATYFLGAVVPRRSFQRAERRL